MTELPQLPDAPIIPHLIMQESITDKHAFIPQNEREILSRDLKLPWTEQEKLTSLKNTYLSNMDETQKCIEKYGQYLHTITTSDINKRKAIALPFMMAHGSYDTLKRLLTDIARALSADGVSYDVHIGAGESYQPLLAARENTAFQFGLDIKQPADSYLNPDFQKVKGAVFTPSGGALYVPVPLQFTGQLLTDARIIQMVCPTPRTQSKLILDTLQKMGPDTNMYVYPDQRNPNELDGTLGYAFEQTGIKSKLTATAEALSAKGIESDFFRGKKTISYYQINKK